MKKLQVAVFICGLSAVAACGGEDDPSCLAAGTHHGCEIVAFAPPAACWKEIGDPIGQDITTGAEVCSDAEVVQSVNGADANCQHACKLWLKTKLFSGRAAVVGTWLCRSTCTHTPLVDKCTMSGTIRCPVQ